MEERRIHGEESVAFSGSVAVELDSEGSIVSTCTEHYILKMLHHSSTYQLHNIPVSARSGLPPQCSTFSSRLCIKNIPYAVLYSCSIMFLAAREGLVSRPGNIHTSQLTDLPRMVP